MRRGVIVWVFALVACASPVALTWEPEVFGPRPLDPVPARYADWYADVEDCLGIRGDFDRVVWTVADSLKREGVRIEGVTLPPHEIVFEAAFFEFAGEHPAYERWKVTHEMSHEITGEGEDLHEGPRNRVPCEEVPGG